MNQKEIKIKAQKLWQLLEKYSLTDDSAMEALNSLRELLKDASKGAITSSINWCDVPCGYLFVGGALGKFKDLEEAYADFKIVVTGGNDPLLEKIRRLK